MNKIYIYFCIISLILSSVTQANENVLPIKQEQQTNSDSKEKQPAILTEQMISRDQYVSGGLVGTVVGFGLGHMVQSRPDRKQGFFMLGELGVIGASMVMLISANSKECTQGGKAESDCINDRNKSSAGVLTLGALAFVGLRVWEIYDLWSYPHVQPLQPKTPKAALLIHPQSSDQIATSFVLRF